MIPRTIIHLLSGGIDSVTMLYDLVGAGDHVHCLLVDYKQAHVQELTFAKFHCHRLNVLFTTLEVPALGGLNGDDWVVPNRNAILLSLAVGIAVRAKADNVTIGCNKDDAVMFPDCRKEFIDSMNASVRAAGYDVEICAPYIAKAKWEILGLAQEIGVGLYETWTCYRGGEKPCGRCPACEKLQAAIR